MVRLLSLFLALYALPASAAFQVGQQYVVGCNQQIPLPVGVSTSQIINLGCYNVSSGDFCTFRKPNGSSGYPVTALKTLHIFAACAIGTSTGTIAQANLFYGTTDVGMNGGSPPSGVVYNYGDASMWPMSTGLAGINNIPSVTMLDFTVPAGDYAGSKNTGSITYVFAWGYEL